MRIRLIAIGRMKKGPETELTNTYLARARAIGSSVGLSQFDVLELPESRASSSAARKKDEAARISEKLTDDSLLIVLDERGEDLSSRKFAQLLQTEADNGRQDCVLVIGGPDGLDADFRERAKQCLRFGSATWPHQIVRILLAEQLYRAITILQGHPYHRD